MKACATSPDVSETTSGAGLPLDLKVVIAGSFGVGKTTLVDTLSETGVLHTEEVMTTASTATDHLDDATDKTTTTVAMDFGKITFTSPRYMVLYLFGTPGQDRFDYLWDDVLLGALGVVVLVDTRCLASSFRTVTWCEQRQVPFIVAVNAFDGAHRYSPDEIRHALGLAAFVPIITCDVRHYEPARAALTSLVSHSLHLRRAAAPGARR
ncbi:ATP/GTP-binding protein [Streptomyces chrestomyceticus]|uniref:GTP-binding protein n=1 Tax=Streptomyces chrestomyceticus TaxID=68185 RepID=UPI0033C1D597